MDNNGWSKYEIHVLNELKRLGDNISDLDASTKALLEKNHQIVEDLKIDVVKLKNDYKWYVKIVSGVWAVIGTIISIVWTSNK